jgi:hypothetical protein
MNKDIYISAYYYKKRYPNYKAPCLALIASNKYEARDKLKLFEWDVMRFEALYHHRICERF